MSTRDWILFASTFVIAVLCGMYLYYTTFVPAYITNPVATDIAAGLQPNWIVGVRVYGACERSGQCPSYSLDSRARYRYQPTPTAAVESGRVPGGIRAAYDEVLTAPQLEAWAEPSSAAGCASATDRLEYRILVTTPQARYDLNTCGTALSQNARLVTLVRETLSSLDNPDQFDSAERTDGESLQGFLERQLDEAFDYDNEPTE